jgi:MtN3 and saliva related transmembrane protein
MNILLHYTSLVGAIAAVFTTIAFIPQAYHSYKTRDLSGVSLPMYSIFTLGVALWLAYGLLLHNWPLIIANAITLALSMMILVLKIKHSTI